MPLDVVCAFYLDTAFLGATHFDWIGVDAQRESIALYDMYNSPAHPGRTLFVDRRVWPYSTLGC